MSANRDTSQKIGWTTKGNLIEIERGNKPTSEFQMTAFEPLRNSFIELQRLQMELKQMIDELEELVKE